MAGEDRVVCGTCLTLNPPDAPACTRCNSSLTRAVAARPSQPAAGQPGGDQWGADRPDAGSGTAPAAGRASGPHAGAGQRGAGQAGAGQDGAGQAGGAAQTAAARAKRPGRDDRLSAITPAAQRRIVRRVQIVGSVLIVLMLVIGGYVVWRTRDRPIDTAAVATDIGTQLSQQLGQPVRVRCPEQAARRAGTTFDCTATDAAGDSRTVVVTVTGDDGAYRWQLR